MRSLLFHDSGVATREIEDLAIVGLMSSTPAELEFLVMKILELFLRVK